MAQQTWTKKDFWAKLDADGEDVVRERLATGQYGNLNHKRELAQEWLRLKENERSEARARSELETAREAAAATRDMANEVEAQSKLAREANELAREANRHALAANDEAREANRIAQRANRIAIAAAVAAAIGIIIAFTALVHGWWN